MSTPFSCFPFVQELLLILRCRVVCLADGLFRRLSSLNFQVSLIFVPGMSYSNCWHVSDDRNVGGCFLDTLELGGGGVPWSGRCMCVLALLPIWYYGMELIPLSFVLLLLSACSMARGQEETSTSQAGRRRGSSQDTPSASSIISSLSMEKLRSYCQFLTILILSYQTVRPNPLSVREIVQYILPGNSSQSGFASPFHL